ncbi:hypothetical protein A5722_30595 [Mycobacterium vulneris]|nr:hypothetical protein A5637_05695 [Mycolicibacterium fortuitum]OCB47910.1 hypothetical protein A5721_07410 [Mycolicibacterium vulneris]OCB51803.1 hypothetical protein A5722_30595 [Mycolicibacterium vulneris]OCB64615.1 hypothetical protein A5729_03215 [Mycolicibacterium vulneris]
MSGIRPVLAWRYRDQMTEFYLMYGQPRDPLDAQRQVPTRQDLDTNHFDLGEKLRNYELKAALK